MRRPVIGVMGPGNEASKIDIKRAFDIGRRIAMQGWVTLTGGRSKGVMHIACQGAKSAGGMTVGVLPSADDSDTSEYVDVAIVTGMGSARNNINVLSSDVIIACGMGTGTASEIALALKADKDVILLNDDKESQNFFKALGKERVAIAESSEQAIALAKDILLAEKAAHGERV